MSNELIRRVDGDLIEASRAPTPGAIVPRVDVRVRLGTMDDLPFIDGLQKAHTREVGFLPRMALEGTGCVAGGAAGGRERLLGAENLPASSSHLLMRSWPCSRTLSGV